MISIPNGAKCRTGAILCDYEVLIDQPDAQVERCRICHRRQIYRKIDGRVDNERYLADHMRFYLQPTGPTEQLYYRIYGTGHVRVHEEYLRSRKQDPDAIRLEAQDALRTMKRTSTVF
jgi:hypothetical protein